MELFVFVTSDFEFVVEFSDLTRGQSQILLSVSDLVAKRRVFGEQFLNLHFVGLRLTVILFDSVSVLIEFRLEFRLSRCRQSQILLSVSDFVAERRVFREQFLNFHFIGVALLVVALDSVSVVVEFGLQFGHCGGRESQIFLSVSDFVAQYVVLTQQFLNAVFVLCALLVVLIDSAFVFLQFLYDFLVLVCRQSQVFLYVLELSFHICIFMD